MNGFSMSKRVVAMVVSCGCSTSCLGGVGCESDSEQLLVDCGTPDPITNVDAVTTKFSVDSSMLYTFAFAQTGCTPISRIASGSQTSFVAVFARGTDSCNSDLNGFVSDESDDGSEFEVCADGDSVGPIMVTGPVGLGESDAHANASIGTSVLYSFFCVPGYAAGAADSTASTSINASNQLVVGGNTSVEYGDYSGNFQCNGHDIEDTYESAFSGNTIAFQETTAAGNYQQEFASSCTPTIEIDGFMSASVSVLNQSGSESSGVPNCVTHTVAAGTYTNALYVRISADSTTPNAFSSPLQGGMIVGRNGFGTVAERLGMFHPSMGYTTLVPGGYELSMDVVPTLSVSDFDIGVEVIAIDVHSADLNYDGVVCFDDYLVLHAAIGSGLNDAAYTPVLDFDLDGDIDTDDVGDAMTAGSFAALYLASEQLAGDANCDCTVGTDDVNAVLSGWGGAGPSGDLNFDGVVDSDDMNIVLANWGNSC